MDAIFVVWIASSVLNVRAVKSLAGACEMAREVKGRAFRADDSGGRTLMACIKTDAMGRQYHDDSCNVPEPITTEVCVVPAADPTGGSK